MRIRSACSRCISSKWAAYCAVGADADPDPADRALDQVFVAAPPEHVRFGVGLVGAPRPPERAAPAVGTPAGPAGDALAGAAGFAGAAAALGASVGLLPLPPPITAPLGTLTRYAASRPAKILAAAVAGGLGIA